MAKPRHFVVKTIDNQDLVGPYMKSTPGDAITHTGSMHLSGSLVIQEHRCVTKNVDVTLPYASVTGIRL